MEGQNSSWVTWILCSVIVTLSPLLILILFDLITKSKLPTYNEMLDSIILIVFSLTCNLIAICINVYNKKKKYTIITLFFSISLSLISLILYTFCVASSNNKIKMTKEVCIFCYIIILLSTIIGTILNNVKDKNANENFEKIISNCAQIREKCFKEKCKKAAEPFLLKQNDLLCNPKEFDRFIKSLEKNK